MSGLKCYRQKKSLMFVKYKLKAQTSLSPRNGKRARPDYTVNELPTPSLQEHMQGKREGRVHTHKAAEKKKVGGPCG